MGVVYTMTDNESAILAKIMLQGLVLPEQVADQLLLTGSERANFISNVNEAIEASLIDDSVYNDNISRLAKSMSLLSLSNTGGPSPSSKIAQVTAPGGIDLSALVLPYILRASNLMDNTREFEPMTVEKGLNYANIALANAETILSHTIMDNASAIASTVMGGSLSVGLGIIEECQYSYEKDAQEQHVRATIEAAEKSYFKLYKSYANVFLHYQKGLSKLKEERPHDLVAYQNKIEEWLRVEALFVAEIHSNQQKIATVSAMSQEKQSQRRLERVQSGLSAMLSLSALAGPPGAIASMLLQALATLGFTLGNREVSESARLNHGIVSAHNLLFITDKRSLEIARERLPQTFSPALALSGPTLTPTLIIDTKARTPDEVAAKLVADLGDRRSCSFSLLKPLSEIPNAGTPDADKNFTNDPVLKAAGKKTLKNLAKAQIELNEQLRYLSVLSETLMRERKPWPAVINLHELMASLIAQHAAIHAQKDRVILQMGPQYYSRSTESPTASDKLLLELKKLDADFAEQFRNLEKLESDLEKTPHNTLLSKGIPIRLRTASSATHDAIKSAYKRNEKAKTSWLKDLSFNLEALETMLNASEKLGHGHHIQNASDALEEINTQLQILHEFNLTPVDQQLYDYCQKKVTTLAVQDAKLDQSRLEMVLADQENLETKRNQYLALSQFQENLLNYPSSALTTIELNLPIHTMGITRSVEDQLDDAKSYLLEGVEEELQQATPVNMEEMAETDAIVSPNRLFFGLDKHEEMSDDITHYKIAQLKQQNTSLNRLQIQPLGTLSAGVLATCRGGEHSQLKKVIEGLKTEIQWIAKFHEACVRQGIMVTNAKQLTCYYDQQIRTLRLVYQNDTLIKTAQHDIFKTDVELELRKAEKALVEVPICQMKLIGLKKIVDQAMNMDSTIIRILSDGDFIRDHKGPFQEKVIDRIFRQAWTDLQYYSQVWDGYTNAQRDILFDNLCTTLENEMNAVEAPPPHKKLSDNKKQQRKVLIEDYFEKKRAERLVESEATHNHYCVFKEQINQMTVVIPQAATEGFPLTDNQVAFQINTMVMDSFNQLSGKIPDEHMDNTERSHLLELKTNWAKMDSVEQSRLFEQLCNKTCRKLSKAVVAATPGLEVSKIESQIKRAAAKLIYSQKSPSSYHAYLQKVEQIVISNPSLSVTQYQARTATFNAQINHIIDALINESAVSSQLSNRAMIISGSHKFLEGVTPLFSKALDQLKSQPDWETLNRAQQDEFFNRLCGRLNAAIAATGPITEDKKQKRQVILDEFFVSLRQERVKETETLHARAPLIKEPNVQPSPLLEAIEQEEEKGLSQASLVEETRPALTRESLEALQAEIAATIAASTPSRVNTIKEPRILNQTPKEKPSLFEQFRAWWNRNFGSSKKPKNTLAASHEPQKANRDSLVVFDSLNSSSIQILNTLNAPFPEVPKEESMPSPSSDNASLENTLESPGPSLDEQIHEEHVNNYNALKTDYEEWKKTNLGVDESNRSKKPTIPTETKT